MSFVAKEHLLLAEARRRNALSLVFFLCAAFAFLLRFTISPQMLNMIMPYSTEGGSFPQKLHVGTYAIFMVLLISLSRPVSLKGEEVGLFKAVLRYSILILLLVPYLFIVGRAGSAGFIIDSYLVACAAGLIMICSGDIMRRALGNVVLGMLILSALIGTTEAITHHRFLPYTLTELDFRPTGLSGHPLAMGALCATAIGFVALANWRIWLRALWIVVLFVGVAASGARAALLLAIAEIFVLLLFAPWPNLSPRHQRAARLFVMVTALSGGAALMAILISGGLLSRFSSTLFDENFQARVTIYQVFGLVSWKDIMFGMNPNELLAIVNKKLGLPYIESAPVTISLLFGLPIALIFAASFFAFIFRLLRGAPLAARIGAFTFLLTALTNNALSSKAPDITILVILLLAYRRPVTDPGAAAAGLPNRL